MWQFPTERTWLIMESERRTDVISEREEMREGVGEQVGPARHPHGCTTSHLSKHPYSPPQIRTSSHRALYPRCRYFMSFLPPLILTCVIYSYTQIKIHLLTEIKKEK